MYEQMFGQAYQQAESEKKARRKRGGWTQPTRQRPKKIDPSIGEYVRFQEIEVTTESNTHTTENSSQSYTIEQQVSDAEWEDIKD